MNFVQSATLFVASILSGMLGVGVGFAAIPIVSLSYAELAHQVQPIALFLNGASALAAAMVFAVARLVEWRRATVLAAVCTVFTPVGAVIAGHTPAGALWGGYIIAVAVVVVEMLRAPRAGGGGQRFSEAVCWAAPIALVSGLVGVGPGFLMVPLLIAFGFSPRAAAAMNAVAVVPASFAAFLAHLPGLGVEISELVVPVTVAALGSAIGAVLSSKFVPEKSLRQAFVVILVGVCVYRAASLVGVLPAREEVACANGADSAILASTMRSHAALHPLTGDLRACP